MDFMIQYKLHPLSKLQFQPNPKTHEKEKEKTCTVLDQLVEKSVQWNISVNKLHTMKIKYFYFQEICNSKTTNRP